MPALSLSTFLSLDGQNQINFQKNITWPHTEKFEETLQPGQPATITPSPVIGAGSCCLVITSKLQTMTPYVPSPFTVSLDGGPVMQVDDLFAVGLSAKPGQIVIGLPQGAGPTDVKVVLVGQ